MQRFVVAIALAVLALPTQAGAKGYISLSVCGTNGCPSFLMIDSDRKVAFCEVCGYTRRLA